jgi:hypothetical protein
MRGLAATKRGQRNYLEFRGSLLGCTVLMYVRMYYCTVCMAVGASSTGRSRYSTADFHAHFGLPLEGLKSDLLPPKFACLSAVDWHR